MLVTSLTVGQAGRQKCRLWSLLALVRVPLTLNVRHLARPFNLTNGL
jgi:hypothetical protein